MSQPPILEANAVSKRFGSTQALSEMSLAIHSSEVVALIGENGAGKSTLVKVLCGVHQPDAGEVLLDGVPGAFADARDAAVHGVHLVHQELALLPERTVTENIFLGTELRGRLGLLDWAAMRRHARTVLAELGAEAVDPDVRVKELSTGSQQMVEIARALVGSARAIILDEPTAALSPAEAEHLFTVMRTMTARGIAFVYISHRLAEIQEIADTVVVMKDGRHVTTRPRRGFTTNEMITLMVGREMADLFLDRAEPVDRSRQPVVVVEDVVDPPKVRSASLTLWPGEIVGLYGLEGHGQDELLACLAGARKPAAGTLQVDGKPLPWPNVAQAARLGFGYVPEDRKAEGLLLEFSGTWNLTLPILRTSVARHGVVSTGAETLTALAAASRAGIKGDIGPAVSTLSGGNQQKVVLAKWIAADSRVLFLNQPTRGVDVGSKAEIYTLIRGLCAEHDVAALVVSREISELKGLCDRILVMSHGTLAAEFPVTASEEEILAGAVGGL